MPNLEFFKGDREKRNAWYREYYQDNLRKLRRYKRLYARGNMGKSPKDKEIIIGKNKARTMLREAVRQGIIKKYPCEVCGNKKVHGHHSDYQRPLYVSWLCVTHHAEEHAKMRKKVVSKLSTAQRLTRKRR